MTEKRAKSRMLRGRMATSSSPAFGVPTVGKALAEGDSARKPEHGSEAVTHGGDGGGGRRTLTLCRGTYIWGRWHMASWSRSPSSAENARAKNRQKVSYSLGKSF